VPTDTPTPATTPAPKCPECGEPMARWRPRDATETLLRCVSCGTTRPLGWTGDAPDAGRGGEPRAEGGCLVAAMTPAEFHATVKSLCDPLARFTPRDVMHFTCLRLVKTVGALAASAEKTAADRDEWRRRAEAAERSLRHLHDAIRERHYGRMPDDVAGAMKDAAEYLGIYAAAEAEGKGEVQHDQ
jgi:hypothetical protein